MDKAGFEAYLVPMPSVKVSKDTNLSAQESFKRVSSLLENDSELKKLDPKYVCDFNPDSLSGSAKGSQFKANMNIAADGSGSKIEIVVDLPFHLALVKGLVQKTLEKKLEQALS
jgi:hypothetical protein